MPPQLTPLDGAVRYPARRERGDQDGARRGHGGGTGTIGGDDQVKFSAVPRDRHPSSGHPLPDMPPHHRLPAREGQRCSDRALPPGPPRNTRPPLLPVASHTQIAPRRKDRCPAGASRPGRTRPQTPAVTDRAQPTGRARAISAPARRGALLRRSTGVCTSGRSGDQIDSRPCRETSGSADVSVRSQKGVTLVGWLGHNYSQPPRIVGTNADRMLARARWDAVGVHDALSHPSYPIPANCRP